MLVSATTTAVVVFPTDGVFPFHESGTIISGVTYAPLMVSVDLFSVRNMARNFYNTSVVASRNEPLLPRQTLLEFAARPLEQVDEIIGIMEASSFYGRAERQAAAFISVGMSAWALARTYQIQSQVDELAQNQAHLASTVDWMATHMKKEDVFMNTLNKDVRVLAQQQQAIVALVTEFGYFGQARQFSRKIDSLHRGALGLVEGRLSSQLMPAEQLNRAFRQLVRKAKKQGASTGFSQLAASIDARDSSTLRGGRANSRASRALYEPGPRHARFVEVCVYTVDVQQQPTRLQARS